MWKRSVRVGKNFSSRKRLPEWLRTAIKTNGEDFRDVKKLMKEMNLSTVCEEARCPNIGECWGECCTSTIMLMGDTCTRNCGFCSVNCSNSPPELDSEEPMNTAKAISKLGLDYVVLTTVSRDDLSDSGADHMAQTVQEIKKLDNSILVELLANDLKKDDEQLDKIANCGLEVFAHNLETVKELTPKVRDIRATYNGSLYALQKAKEFNPNIVTKTSLMLGLGETDEQILEAMKDLRDVDCDVITFGQYLQPTSDNLEVVEYVTPEKFDYWKEKADEMGFLYCASGPHVRSSYKAGEFYIKNISKKKKNIEV